MCFGLQNSPKMNREYVHPFQAIGAQHHTINVPSLDRQANAKDATKPPQRKLNPWQKICQLDCMPGDHLVSTC